MVGSYPVFRLDDQELQSKSSMQQLIGLYSARECLVIIIIINRILCKTVINMFMMLRKRNNQLANDLMPYVSQCMSYGKVIGSVHLSEYKSNMKQLLHAGCWQRNWHLDSACMDGYVAVKNNISNNHGNFCLKKCFQGFIILPKVIYLLLTSVHGWETL